MTATRPIVALLSNPRSTGNRAALPRIRSFCAQHSELFHYEVERLDQIADALRTIARVQPRVLIVNGGDGTVQAVLTEMYLGGHFGDAPPPMAVLPNGKTNLIALDLGASGDPIDALARILEIAKGDMTDHVVARELIALSDGHAGSKPVLGMFLGGAGLADSILYCRQKIYPLGLPNGLSHLLTALAVLLSLVLGVRAAFLPPRPSPVKVSLLRRGQIQGRFSLLIVTTLQKLLLATSTGSIAGSAGLRLMAVDQNPLNLLRACFPKVLGWLGKPSSEGVHLERDDEIRIEGAGAGVILDGEIFTFEPGRSIVLKPTAPKPFLRLAA